MNIRVYQGALVQIISVGEFDTFIYVKNVICGYVQNDDVEVLESKDITILRSAY